MAKAARERQRPKYTRNAEICADRDAGMRVADIAFKHGVSRQRVHQLLMARAPQPSREKGGAYVYVFKCGKYLKVGVSKYPHARQHSMQSLMPYPVQLLAVKPGTRADEAAVHRALEAARAHYEREWFVDSRRARQALVAQGLAVPAI